MQRLKTVITWRQHIPWCIPQLSVIGLARQCIDTRRTLALQNVEAAPYHVSKRIITLQPGRMKHFHFFLTWPPAYG